MRDSLTVAGLLVGFLACFVALPAGLLMLGAVGLMAYVTRRTAAVIEAAPDTASKSAGCSIGVLVLLGLFVGFVVLVQGMGL